MQVFRKIIELSAFLEQKRKEGKTVGFVPTMGALHKGHISLIELANLDCDISVCSVFVNPIQFNKKEDLDKYPRNFEADQQKLKAADCDVIFYPSVEEMYPEEVTEKYEFGALADVMEGEHRPGHFNGVAVVVNRFFEIIQPHNAYFGEKDFQQLAIIRAMVKQKNHPIKIIGCPIIREQSGLAMSSRNERLSNAEKNEAAAIYKALTFAKNEVKNSSIPSIKENVLQQINSSDLMEVEYFEIADGYSLQPVDNTTESDYLVAFIAVNMGPVRLIDNMTLTGN